VVYQAAPLAAERLQESLLCPPCSPVCDQQSRDQAVWLLAIIPRTAHGWLWDVSTTAGDKAECEGAKANGPEVAGVESDLPVGSDFRLVGPYRLGWIGWMDRPRARMRRDPRCALCCA
jgi:hypothetical protein